MANYAPQVEPHANSVESMQGGGRPSMAPIYEMYGEKMVSTGVKQWPGIDVQVYQKICVGRPWKARMGLPPEPVS